MANRYKTEAAAAQKQASAEQSAVDKTAAYYAQLKDRADKLAAKIDPKASKEDKERKEKLTDLGRDANGRKLDVEGDGRTLKDHYDKLEPVLGKLAELQDKLDKEKDKKKQADIKKEMKPLDTNYNKISGQISKQRDVIKGHVQYAKDLDGRIDKLAAETAK